MSGKRERAPSVSSVSSIEALHYSQAVDIEAQTKPTDAQGLAAPFEDGTSSSMDAASSVNGGESQNEGIPLLQIQSTSFVDDPDFRGLIEADASTSAKQQNPAFTGRELPSNQPAFAIRQLSQAGPSRAAGAHASRDLLSKDQSIRSIPRREADLDDVSLQNHLPGNFPDASPLIAAGVVGKDSDAPTSDASEAWANCAKQVWDYEEAVVAKWKDEISNLLIFAGLFSAALTAFNVQYYISLQPQSPDPTAQALIIMSAQLSMLVVSAGHTDITQTMLAALVNSSSVPTRISAHVVSVNTLWFSSLVFSLGAASIAISVNQWLHHHTTRTATMSRQSVRIWYYRHHGLLKWQVPFIISILPVLLQIALALFLIGLVQLLWTLNHIVAGVVTGLVGILLTLSLFTMLIPARASDCPYKSPQSWWWFVVARNLRRPIFILMGYIYRWSRTLSSHRNSNFARIADETSQYLSKLLKTHRTMLKLANWRDFDNFIVRSKEDRVEDKLAMLVEADAALMDDSFLTQVVRPCLDASTLKAAIPVFYDIIQHGAHDVDIETNPPTFKWLPTEQDSQRVVAMGTIAVDMLNRMTPYSDPYIQDYEATRIEADHARILGLLENLLIAMPSSEPAVYRRLPGILQRTDISRETRSLVASLINKFDHQFDVDIGQVQELLSCIPILPGNVKEMTFLRLSTSVVKMLRRMAKPDFDRVQNDSQLVGVRSIIVNRNFSSQVATSITEGQNWYSVYLLLKECINLEKLHYGLFESTALDVLNRFARECPQNTQNFKYIQESIGTLCGLIQSPVRPSSIVLSQLTTSESEAKPVA